MHATRSTLALLLTASTLLGAAPGCAGRYGAAATTPAGAPPRGVEAAGLPYTILDARTGRQVDEPAFWQRLAAASAVCVGEEHPNPHHHWVQLRVVGELAARGAGHARLGLGMEMFQRPFQGVLDDFAARRIDEPALLSRSGWEDRWGYDYALYRPVIARAVAAGGALVALNAARELAKKIVREGLEALTADERRDLPELDLRDPAHRAWFDAVMAEMGGGSAHASPHAAPAKDGEAEPASPAEPADAAAGPASPGMPSAERVYTVQVLWDETMADGAARWLRATPGGRLVILAGAGHCHDSAIVGRLKRRGVGDAISLRTIIDDGDGAVAEALARPMNDYLVVLALPADAKAAHAEAGAAPAAAPR